MFASCVPSLLNRFCHLCVIHIFRYYTYAIDSKVTLTKPFILPREKNESRKLNMVWKWSMVGKGSDLDTGAERSLFPMKQLSAVVKKQMKYCTGRKSRIWEKSCGKETFMLHEVPCFWNLCWHEYKFNYFPPKNRELMMFSELMIRELSK